MSLLGSYYETKTIPFISDFEISIGISISTKKKGKSASKTLENLKERNIWFHFYMWKIHGNRHDQIQIPPLNPTRLDWYHGLNTLFHSSIHKSLPESLTIHIIIQNLACLSLHPLERLSCAWVRYIENTEESNIIDHCVNLSAMIQNKLFSKLLHYQTFPIYQTIMIVSWLHSTQVTLNPSQWERKWWQLHCGTG